MLYSQNDAHYLPFLEIFNLTHFHPYHSLLPLLSSSFHPAITSLPQNPSRFPISPLSPIDSFDCGRWRRPVVCHEIIVSSLPPWWALHHQLLIYLLTQHVSPAPQSRASRFTQTQSNPISIKGKIGTWVVALGGHCVLNTQAESLEWMTDLQENGSRIPLIF